MLIIDILVLYWLITETHQLALFRTLPTGSSLCYILSLGSAADASFVMTSLTAARVSLLLSATIPLLNTSLQGLRTAVVAAPGALER